MSIHTAFGGKDSAVDRSHIGIIPSGVLNPAAYTVFLNQTHSCDVIVIDDLQQDLSPAADAVVTRLPGLALAVKTADCAPVLLWDEEARVIAAMHSGWQGTLQNIAAFCVDVMVGQGAAPSRMQAVIGPCLQRDNFYVGIELVERFVAVDAVYADFFTSSTTEPGKSHLDHTALVLWQLAQCGVTSVTADPTCTLAQSDRYYSYRSRDADTAHDTMRNVALIWMD